MAVYSPFSSGLRAPKHRITHPIFAASEGDIEDSADQRRLSNAGLDRSEHITESINGITDISDEDDAKSVRVILLFNRT